MSVAVFGVDQNYDVVVFDIPAVNLRRPESLNIFNRDASFDFVNLECIFGETFGQFCA